MMRDKRKFPRLRSEWQLTYRVLEDDKFLTDPIRQFTVNISGGGICFTSEVELKTNTMVALELVSEQPNGLHDGRVMQEPMGIVHKDGGVLAHTEKFLKGDREVLHPGCLLVV